MYGLRALCLLYSSQQSCRECSAFDVSVSLSNQNALLKYRSPITQIILFALSILKVSNFKLAPPVEVLSLVIILCLLSKVSVFTLNFNLFLVKFYNIVCILASAFAWSLEKRAVLGPSQTTSTIDLFLNFNYRSMVQACLSQEHVAFYWFCVILNFNFF